MRYYLDAAPIIYLVEHANLSPPGSPQTGGTGDRSITSELGGWNAA